MKDTFYLDVATFSLVEISHVHYLWRT